MGRRNVAPIVACTVALAAASQTALAQEGALGDSIENFLNDVQSQVDEAKIGKIQVKPSLRESVIWTDNLFLNDRGEDPVRLTRVVTRSGRSITDRRLLDGWEDRTPGFRDTATQGRVNDFIVQSQLDVNFDLPVNEEYSKLFQKEHMTVLGLSARNQEYLDRNELDNSSVFAKTDVFGVLSDLLSLDVGNAWWIRFRDSYSRLRDPLDVSLRLLGGNGLLDLARFKDFRWTENTANLDAGWRGGQLDATLGYENYNLWLDDAVLRQAQHRRQNVHLEVGSEVPWWAQKRAFVRYDFWQYDFSRAPVTRFRVDPGSGLFVGFASPVDEQILNDADVHRWLVGMEGPFLSEKIRARAEAGYLWWDAREDSFIPPGETEVNDTNDFSGAVGALQARYQPWDDSRSFLQARYERRVGYSAISNYNAEHDASVTALYEVIPKRFDLQATVAFTHTKPSQGPVRSLYEGGVAATWHVYKQVDLVLRYLLRVQYATREVRIPASFGRGGRNYEYEVSSDGDFYQNIVEIALDVHF